MWTRKQRVLNEPILSVSDVADYLQADLPLVDDEIDTTSVEYLLLQSLTEAAMQDMEAYCKRDIGRYNYSVFFEKSEITLFSKTSFEGVGIVLADLVVKYRNSSEVWVNLLKDTHYKVIDDGGNYAIKWLAFPTDLYAETDYDSVFQLNYAAGYTAATFEKNGVLSLLLWVSRAYDDRMDSEQKDRTKRVCEIYWNAYRNIVL